MAANVPEFGVAGLTKELTITKTVEPLEFNDGLQRKQYALRRSLPIRKTLSDDTMGWGIAASTNATSNTLECPLTSVTINIVEETSDPNIAPTTDYATAAGADVAVTKVLTGVNGLLFLRKKETWTITGKGALPAVLDKDLAGSVLPTITIKSATRAATAFTLTNAFISNINQTNTNSSLATFSCTLEKYTATTDATGATHLITVDASAGTAASTSAATCFTTADLTSDFYTVSKTISMSDSGYVSVEEELTNYDEITTSVITTTDEVPS